MKFVGSYLTTDGTKVLTWESETRLPNDSRVMQVRCNAAWFWSPCTCDVRGIGKPRFDVRCPQHGRVS